MDEPASPATLAANKLWLQSYHPEHFFKETDWVPPSSPESGGIAATGGDYLAAKNKLNPSSRNGKDSSGSSKTPRNAADSAVPSGGKENITSRSFHRRPADTEWGMGEENERWAQKRNEDEVVGRRPTKRRRAVGGVMVSFVVVVFLPPFFSLGRRGGERDCYLASRLRIFFQGGCC